MKFNNKLFVEKIKANMKYKDTLRKMSSETGVSASTLSRVMRVSDAKISTILAICKWMDVSIDEFVVAEDEYYVPG